MPDFNEWSGQIVSLTDRTIEVLQDRIRTGILVPGELYSVYRLADELGVSRSPVREALLRLTETGMVVIEKNRGFRVMIPGPRELTEIMAVRLALEVPAAGRVVQRIGSGDLAALHAERDAMRAAVTQGDEGTFLRHDQRLHSLLLHLAGNTRVTWIIENLRDATRLVDVSTIRESRSMAEVHREHLPVLIAVERGDAEDARNAMRVHLESTERLLLRRAAETAASADDRRLWNELIG